MDYSNLFVCVMGICTVFIGLVCIIILVSVMSGIVRRSEKAMTKREESSRYDPERNTDPVIRPSRVPAQVTPELIAAISAAIAEDMGTDISAIRITSLKQV